MSEPSTFCTVYLGAADGKGNDFGRITIEVGTALAKRGFGIVYGGANTGCMGKLADAALQNNGHVVGIFPDGKLTCERKHTGLTDLVLVDSMNERKRLLLEGGDCVIILPGGTGTFEEFFEAVSGRALNHHQKPIYVLNIDGYYDSLTPLFDAAIKNEFMNPELKLFEFVKDVEELLEKIEKHFNAVCQQLIE